MRVSARLAGVQICSLRMVHLILPLAVAAVLMSCCLLMPAWSRDGATTSAGMGTRPMSSNLQLKSSLPRLQALLVQIANDSMDASVKDGLLKELLGPPSSEAPLTASVLLGQLAEQPRSFRSRVRSRSGSSSGSEFKSCAHRSEHSSYPWAPLAASATFEKAAAAYETFHAKCTSVGGKASQLLSSGTTPPCKYMVYTVTRLNNGGLGNQLLGLVSTLLYGMLTARVILVHEKTLPRELLCEPFSGSEWVLPDAAMHVPIDPTDGNVGSFPCDSTDRGAYPGVWNETVGKTQVVFLDTKHCSVGRLVSFSGSASQALEAADWLAVFSNQFFLPALYHQPRFLPLLREMFPDNRPAARLMRHFFHPIDKVWQQVKQAYAENMANQGYRIGTQLRFFQKPVDTDDFLKRLIRCGHTTGKLPRLDELHDRGEASVRLFDGLTDRSIFIGSLEAGVKSGVHSVYSTSKSKPVQFHVFETNNDTIDDYNIRDHTEKALVDIWLLSYAQTLIVTPTSTYGHVAMALGNTETWVLDREPLDGCSKARSLEPCLQVLPTVYRNELAGKAESSGRVGFQKSLFGVVSECNDQPGGLSFVTS